MVRLQQPDDLTDTSVGSKRSRPVSSSLDYKASGRDGVPKLVVDSADDSKEEDTVASSSTGSQTNTLPLMGMNPTRARGSSGFLPPSKLAKKDIDSMTQEEIMEMIMNDPELSAKFAEQQKKERFASSSDGQQNMQRGSNRRSTNNKKPSMKSSKDRIELLKEQGIPYEQWTILLVLLIFSLYQLYKWMQPPSKSHRKSSAQRLTNVDDDMVAAELEGAVAQSNIRDKNKHKRPHQKKKTASAVPKKSTPPVAATVPTPPPRPNVPVLVEEEVPPPSYEEEDNWMPVVKKTKEMATPAPAAEDAITVHTANTSKKKKKMPAPPIPAVVEHPVRPSQPMADPTPAAEEMVVDANGTTKVPPATSNPEDELVKEPTDVKKKKLKKKKPKNGTAPAPATTNSPDVTMDADAILAQQLQYEEDQLAAAASTESVAAAVSNGGASSSKDDDDEDAWAEVTKKKGKSAVVVNSTLETTTATTDLPNEEEEEEE